MRPLHRWRRCSRTRCIFATESGVSPTDKGGRLTAATIDAPQRQIARASRVAKPFWRGSSQFARRFAFLPLCASIAKCGSKIAALSASLVVRPLSARQEPHRRLPRHDEATQAVIGTRLRPLAHASKPQLQSITAHREGGRQRLTHYTERP